MKEWNEMEQRFIPARYHDNKKGILSTIFLTQFYHFGKANQFLKHPYSFNIPTSFNMKQMIWSPLFLFKLLPKEIKCRAKGEDSLTQISNLHICTRWHMVPPKYIRHPPPQDCLISAGFPRRSSN